MFSVSVWGNCSVSRVWTTRPYAMPSTGPASARACVPRPMCCAPCNSRPMPSIVRKAASCPSTSGRASGRSCGPASARPMPRAAATTPCAPSGSSADRSWKTSATARRSWRPACAGWNGVFPSGNSGGNGICWGCSWSAFPACRRISRRRDANAWPACGNGRRSANVPYRPCASNAPGRTTSSGSSVRIRPLRRPCPACVP